MPAVELRWSNLLQIPELAFKPEAPSMLRVSDELIHSLAILTAATRHDRRLVQCDDLGAVLIGTGWSNLVEVQIGTMHPASGSGDSFTANTANKGVLIATGDQIVTISFKRVESGSLDIVIIPAHWLYWYSHSTYQVCSTVVPDPGGTASYVGVTALN